MSRTLKIHKSFTVLLLFLATWIGISIFFQSVNAGVDPGIPPDPIDPSDLMVNCHGNVKFKRDGSDCFRFYGLAMADIELWYGSTYGLCNFRPNMDKWDLNAGDDYHYRYNGASYAFEYSGVNGVGIIIGYNQTYHWIILNKSDSVLITLSFTVWIHTQNGYGAYCSFSIEQSTEVGHWSYTIWYYSDYIGAWDLLFG